MKYTKKQITEAIKHWQKVLESMNESVSRSSKKVFVDAKSLLDEIQLNMKHLGGNVEIQAKDGQIILIGDKGVSNIILADFDSARAE